jgi:hypothetical protein
MKMTGRIQGARGQRTVPIGSLKNNFAALIGPKRKGVSTQRYGTGNRRRRLPAPDDQNE